MNTLEMAHYLFGNFSQSLSYTLKFPTKYHFFTGRKTETQITCVKIPANNIVAGILKFRCL